MFSGFKEAPVSIEANYHQYCIFFGMKGGTEPRRRGGAEGVLESQKYVCMCIQMSIYFKFMQLVTMWDKEYLDNIDYGKYQLGKEHIDV